MGKLRPTKTFYFLLFTFYFLLCSCGVSVPNLDPPECTDSRNSVREFYSYHIGGDMQPSAENLRAREKFLTANLKNELTAQTETTQDYFTATDDYPKTFRVGGCKVVSPEKTIFSVLLYWKDDRRTEQREIKVETVKENDKWLINKVEN